MKPAHIALWTEDLEGTAVFCVSTSAPSSARPRQLGFVPQALPNGDRVELMTAP